MRSILIVSGLLAVLALAGAPAVARTVTTQAVRGRLVAVDEESDAAGKFRIVVHSRAAGSREALEMDAWGLDAARDDAGDLPSYRAFLVTADGGTEADFGELSLAPSGRARFRFASPRMDFPEGVETLVDFAGGTVEVRRDGAAVLSGDIPEFVGVDDGSGEGSGATARAAGEARLIPTRDGGRAHGLLQALYVNRPRVQFEGIRVECLGLGSAGDEFTVICIDESRNETEVGSMTSRSRFGVALLELSTRAGDTMPGDGVLALGGQRVEVRDARGTAWLVGRFPVLASGE